MLSLPPPVYFCQPDEALSFFIINIEGILLFSHEKREGVLINPFPFYREKNNCCISNTF